MKLGNLNIDGNLFSAPLAGVSDQVFRRFCRRYGASATVSEMISAKGLYHRSEKTLKYLNFESAERPIGIQLFASDADSAKAGLEVALEVKPDFIDFNCGCPVRKVIKQGAGGALLKTPDLLVKILRELVINSPVPVTAKLRSGWDYSSINLPDIAIRLQDIGLAAIFIHPRTVVQNFSAKADRKLASHVVSILDIPVIYSGDICGADDARNVLDTVGCQGIMIGRAAMGDPHIFTRTKHLLEYGEILPEPIAEQKIDMLIDYYKAMIDYHGPDAGMRMMRKFVVWCTKGMPGKSALRHEIFEIENSSQAIDRLIEYRKTVTKSRNMAKTV